MTGSMVVIDASVAMKAILPNPLQPQCLALAKTFIEVQPVAPVLWAYETTSAVAKAVHFEEITEREARQALERLEALGVRVFVPDADQNRITLDWTLRFKRASAYDSYYLALAQTLECDFWTADKRLVNALQDAQLGWLHWIEEIKPS